MSNNERNDSSINIDHISLSNTAAEIKQQIIDENKFFAETELKKNEKILWSFKNISDGAKRDLIKTFTYPDNDMIVDDIINLNHWVNKADDNKQQLDQIKQ